jgi:hypothetical protein
MQAVGSGYLASNPPPGAAGYYNVTMSFIVNVVLGLGQREGSPVALWDAVTAAVLLGAAWHGLALGARGASRSDGRRLP